MKKWLRKIQKILLCFAGISLSSASVGFVTSCNKQKEPIVEEFNVIFDGDTSLATFLNFTAKVGQDYVSIIRFVNKTTDLSELIISCGDTQLPGEAFRYDNIRNELTIYGKYITTNNLVIHFSLQEEEAILEPSKEVKGFTTFSSGCYQSSVDIGAFELLNSEQTPSQLDIIINEIGSSVLGQIALSVDIDDTTPNLFYLSLHFSGCDYPITHNSTIGGYVPPGNWHLSISIRNNVTGKDLIIDSEYVVSFQTSILDIQIPNKYKALVATKYVASSQELKSKVTLPYENNSGFFVVNPPESLNLDNINGEIKISGSVKEIKNIPLTGSIISFGFSFLEDFTRMPGKFQLDIIFSNKNDGTILYENKRDFTLDVNMDIVLPYNQEQQTFGVEQYDEETNQLKVKVTFGSHQDPFQLFNSGYTTDDLSINVQHTGFIWCVPGSAQIHNETVEKNTFSISMEFITPNLNNGSIENIKFIIKTKDDKYSYTFSNFKIQFKLQIQWENPTDDITDIHIDKSNEAGSNFAVGVFALPIFTVYYPPLDILECFQIDIKEKSENGNESLGETGIHKINKISPVRYQCICYFKNIDLFSEDWLFSLNIVLSLRDYSDQITLYGKELVITPLLIYSQPDLGTRYDCGLYTYPRLGNYKLGYIPHGDKEKAKFVDSSISNRTPYKLDVEFSGSRFEEVMKNITLHITNDFLHGGDYMYITMDYSDMDWETSDDGHHEVVTVIYTIVGDDDYKLVTEFNEVELYFSYWD